MAKRTTTEAFSYLRVSGKGQVGGHGFPRQHDAVGRYAKAHRLTVVQEFREPVSGARDGFDRPGLTDLFVAVKSDGVKTVLVERADRLARDLMVGEVILAEFRKLNVKVIATDSGIDLTVADDDPTRVLIRQVLGAVAQFEKSAIVQKLRAARERIRRQGDKCEGRKPFGTFDGEGQVVDFIREFRKKRGRRPRPTWQATADALNDEGLATRSGKPWNPATIWRIARRMKVR